MKTDLNAINGIGQHTAAVLEEHGFTSVEKIAAASVAELMTVPGFGTIRAKRIIELASGMIDKAGAKKSGKKKKSAKKVSKKDKKAEKKSSQDKKKKKGKKKKKK